MNKMIFELELTEYHNLALNYNKLWNKRSNYSYFELDNS